MFIQKNFSLKGILYFAGGHAVWLLLWSTIVVLLYQYANIDWLVVPWILVSIIGTAVAFYIGFKNNQSYDRLWEARKIWGAIVNSSRAWGVMVRGYVTNEFAEKDLDQSALNAHISRMIKRHISWLYALRSQLLIPTPWEHINQGVHMARTTKRRMERFGLGLLDDGVSKEEMRKYMPDDEYEEYKDFQNTATQILDKQSQDLKELRHLNLIDDFRHMALQDLITDFYVQQGKCERIKKFPLPRQYGAMSLIFVGIFIFLLPFASAPEFAKLGTWGIWLSIPFTALVSWVYLIMELVGDYSENPFEGLGNDIPMYSICRVIEIDLLEMMREKDIPAPIEPVNNVLM